MDGAVRLRKKHPPNGLHLSVDSVGEHEKKELLDFDEVHKATQEEIILETNYSDTDSDSDNKDKDKEKKKKKKDDFNPAPKMNTFVGFLRLANFVCACVAIFAVVVSLFYPTDDGQTLFTADFKLWKDVVYFATGWIQLGYICIVAMLIMVDSVATFTFRWKEYGEITYTQADATSIVFLMCKSRWAWRLASGLIMASAVSLRTTRIIHSEAFAPHDHTWYFGLTLVGVASSMIGFLFSLSPWHGVPWLRDQFKMKHVEDKGDVWSRPWEQVDKEEEDTDNRRPLDMTSRSDMQLVPLKSKASSAATQSSNSSSTSSVTSTTGRISLALNKVIGFISKLIFLTAFMATFVFHCLALSIALPHSDQEVEHWILASSFATCQLLNLGTMVVIVIDVFFSCHFFHFLPWMIKLQGPFLLSVAVRSLIEAKKDVHATDDTDEYFEVKVAASYFWLYMMALMVLSLLVELSLRLAPLDNCWRHFVSFLCKNYVEEGVNKKTIRFFDTLGSMAGLAGLVLGICSLFIDQYDLELTPQGFAEDVAEAFDTFSRTIKPVTMTLSKLIDTLDRKFTCDEVYSALGTGTAVTLFASFFPGAGSVASVGSRSAYYGVRAANALTNLANKLRRSKNAIWQFARAVFVLQKFTLGSVKNLIKASNAATIIKLLPFLPPVVIGINILFAAFWPQRVLFFSAKQRRSTVASLLYSRILYLIVLSVAISINTALVDEIVRLLDENIPLVGVAVVRKLGWYLSVVAFGFAYLSTTSYVISALILKIQTFDNHQNITNEELDWKYELEKRELVQIRTGLGVKLEKKTQIRYKKERIGPWTWVLPILLCLISCGFGYLANINPKLEFQLEPKGAYGRVIENVNRRYEAYETDKYDVMNDTEKECLPYTSFGDLWKEKKYSNILMNPVTKFFNETDKLIKPVKDVLTGMRKQLLLDVQDELFGDTINNIWKENNLQYIGMILMVPRALCLLILIFGCLTASIWVCQMRIIQSIDPKKVVNAYGKVALFSLVYVLGSQLALFNLISTFGIPFYHISIRFGLGFIYDLTADFILISVYIGMKNEFFFAIPKRKVTVTYAIPGVSDGGPNAPGQIV